VTMNKPTKKKAKIKDNDKVYRKGCVKIKGLNV